MTYQTIPWRRAICGTILIIVVGGVVFPQVVAWGVVGGLYVKGFLEKMLAGG